MPLLNQGQHWRPINTKCPGEKEAPHDEIWLFNFPDSSHFQIQLDTFKNQTVSVLSAPRLKKNRDDKHRPNLWLAKTADKLYFTRTSRDLKRVDICVADTKSGAVKVLIEERLNTYIDIQPLRLINNGEEMIHWSERDGWGHYYLYDSEGNLKNQITSGPWHCDGVEGVDEANRVLYFRANGKEVGEDPYYTHLYRVNFDGSGLKLLNPGNQNHSANINV